MKNVKFASYLVIAAATATNGCIKERMGEPDCFLPEDITLGLNISSAPIADSIYVNAIL